MYVISMAGVLIWDNKALITQLAQGKAKDLWDIPGGRINKNEIAEQGFRREIKEELGIENFEIISVVDYEIWSPRPHYTVCAIAHLIKSDADTIILSDEHQDYKWISEDEINQYEFFWGCSPRMLKKAFELNRIIEKEI